MPSSSSLPTIHSVAALAKVSTTSVSLALNNSPGRTRMKESTRRRILKVAEKCGYQPNPQARALRSARTFNIGYYFTYAAHFKLTEPSLRLLISSLQRGLWQQGYRLGFYYFEPELRGGFSEFLTPGRFIDALVVHGRNLSPDEISEIRSSGIQAISIDENLPGFHCLTIDEYEAGRQAARFIYECGYRRVAVLGVRLNVERWQGRFLGFFEEAKRLGLNCPPSAHIFTEENAVSAEARIGKELFQRFRAKHPEIKALYVPSDYIALGVLNAMEEMDLKLGSDIGLVSYDNLEGNDYFMGSEKLPGLTSFAPPYAKLGEFAAELITSNFNGRSESHQSFPASLVVRKSLSPRKRIN